MILCVNLNPCVDKTLYLPRLQKDVIQPASRVTTTVGGKANNVARVLKAFGLDPLVLNFLGRETGLLCERLLTHDDSLPLETVWTASPTREIITIHENDLNRHTDIKEPSPVILPPERDALLHRFVTLLPRVSFVSFGGSSPCPLTDDLPRSLLALAREKNIPFVLDTSGNALSLALDSRPWLVKPNRAEAESLFQMTISSPADEVSVLLRLAEKADVAVLSLGPDGFLAARDSRAFRVHPPDVPAVNAVGSGDALVAALIIGEIRNTPFPESLALAAAAASANAASMLACKITPAQVLPLVAAATVDEIPLK